MIVVGGVNFMGERLRLCDAVSLELVCEPVGYHLSSGAKLRANAFGFPHQGLKDDVLLTLLINAEVATVAKPDTILAWYRKLVAHKFDGSKARRGPPASWRARRSCAARLRSASPRRPLPLGGVVWAGSGTKTALPLNAEIDMAACFTAFSLSAAALAAAVSSWRASMRATSLSARERCSFDTSPATLPSR
jgi:hypothetical protein